MTDLIVNSFQNRTYDELSIEFRQLYPAALRAFQLIPLMYNRLTLVDSLTHKVALRKIYDDHKDLPGFSRRNIYRSLPKDNPCIPRKIVPERHKTSSTVTEMANSLSVTEKAKATATESKENERESCPNCQLLRTKKEELEEALEKSAGPTKAANFSPQIQRFTVSKERHRELIDSIEKSVEFIHIEFDKYRTFVSVTPDILYKHTQGNSSQSG